MWWWLTPVKLRLTFRAKRKNDRVDAAKLALLLLTGQVPQVYVPAVVAYIDDAKRFGRNKSIGSYFGLVPSQDASGGVNRLGHITRQGPATVRKLVVEATWQAVRLCPVIANYFERVQRGSDDRKKIALVATGHYLLRVMLSMLRNGEVWRGCTAERGVTA